MLKKVLSIALHRLKGSIIDVVLDVTVGTLDEYRRARRSGEFDLFNSAADDETETNDTNTIKRP